MTGTGDTSHFMGMCVCVCLCVHIGFDPCAPTHAFTYLIESSFGHSLHGTIRSSNLYQQMTITATSRLRSYDVFSSAKQLRL